MHNLKQNTINSYISDNSVSDIVKIKQLINSNFNEVGILIIKSTQGNGATHLMNIIHTELKILQNSCYYTNAEKMIWKLKNSGKDLESDLKPNSFLFIDDVELLLKDNTNPTYYEFKNLMEKYIGINGKIICTHTIHNMDLSYFQSFFGISRIHEIACKRLFFDSLIKVAKQEFESEFVNKYASDAYDKSNSAREFLNRLVNHQAKIQLLSL